jgi:hypothetical protein
MGGDMFQWNEAIIAGENRGFRGDCWGGLSSLLPSSYRTYGNASLEYFGLGFRVASVPEPSTIALLLASAACLLAFAWRRSIGWRWARAA